MLGVRVPPDLPPEYYIHAHTAFMGDEKAEIVFEYAHAEGAWTVSSHEAHFGMRRVEVSDGRVQTVIPVLMEKNQVEMCILKLKDIPEGAVTSFELFAVCVAGAALISVKYNR